MTALAHCGIEKWPRSNRGAYDLVERDHCEGHVTIVVAHQEGANINVVVAQALQQDVDC